MSVVPQVYDGSGGPPTTTMVAVDKDKNSSYAFRWAVNHLDNPLIIVVHVKHKNFTHNHGSNILPPDDDDVANVFGNLRGLYNRKAVQIREAVIDDSDVCKALLEYAKRNFVHTIVVGASTKSPLATSIKKFKGHHHGVPAAMMKSAPDYSNVYIISKWKIASTRPAVRSMTNAPIPPRQSLMLACSPIESENGVRGVSNEGLEAKALERKKNDVIMHSRPRSAGSNQSMEVIDVAARQRHRSMDIEIDISGSMDSIDQDPDFSFSSDSDKSSSASQSTRDIEAEMRRLRFELKQTMDMYSSACKQAISAKNEAEQIRQWKLEEARKVEEVRLSQEAALAIAEQEKARAKAALEAAEEARKIAEQEAQRRKDIEEKVRREVLEKGGPLTALAYNDNRCRKYTIEEIEAATDKFTPSKKIGEGGYGPVYKGQLDHTPVAIKLLNPEAAQGRKQFHQEVEVLSCIRHPNMVLLLGACPEYGCLVYEFMDNGSLEDRLLRKNDTPPIPWRLRFQIAAEIATALLFLHQTKPEPIVHRDLKPANILLSRNYVSKIADVGLSRLVPPSVADSVTQYYMTKAAGTFCYIDPEYQQTGILTTKSDIYSLGIMLLQIITAKPAMGLAHLVRRSIEKGKFTDILDPAVTDWPVEEALAFAKVAMSCAELSKKDRPNLATVVLPELIRLRDIGSNSQHRAIHAKTLQRS